MATATPRSALSAARAAIRSLGEPATDAELLAAFAAGRDEVAFAELVRRHGRLVRGAAHRLVADAEAVEDVCQAVFLLLAKKAAQVRWGRTVGPWLYQATWRLAAKARCRSAHRSVPTRSVPDIAAPAADPGARLAWEEVRAALDEALAQLPTVLCDPLVLCYLEGLTRDEAAAALGCSPTALRGRLERGRERLRRLLERRGLALSAALAGVIVAEPALEAGMAAAVARGAVGYLATGAAPAAVCELLRGALGPAAWKLALGLTGLLFACAAGALGLAGQGPAPTEPPKAPAAQPAETTSRPAENSVDVFGDPLPPGALARMGSMRFHHGKYLDQVIPSPDGKRVASVGATIFYKLWDGDTGRQVELWEGLTPTGPNRVRFSITPAEGQLAAVVWGTERSRLVDPVTGKEIRTLPGLEGNSVDGPELAPDGKTVVAMRHVIRAPGPVMSTLRVWESGKDRWTDLSENGPRGAVPVRFQFAADSKTFAAWRGDGTVEVWDVAKAKALLRLEATGGQFQEAFALSPDGKYLAREDRAAKKVRVWDVATGKELPELPDQPKEFGQTLAFAPDGKTLAGVDKPITIRLWDVPARKKVRDIQAHDYQVHHLAFAAGGKKIFAADGNHVSVWDPTTGEPLDDFGGHRYTIWAVAWSPDGKRLASGAAYTDNVGRVWDAQTGRNVFELRGHESGIEVTAYSPDGSLLATGSQDGTARLWDPATGKEIHSFNAKDGMVYAMAFSPDGRYLVTGGRKVLHVWDVAARTEARTLAHGGGFPLQVIFYPGGKRLLVRDRDTGIRVLDFATGKEEARLAPGEKAPGAEAISPNGRYITAGYDDGSIRLLDAVSAREALVLANGLPQDSGDRRVMSLAFSPNGRTVAATYGHGAVRVLEVATASERFRFAGHPDAGLRVVFSPDGTRLASSGADRTLLVWDVTGARLPPAPPPKDLDTAWTDLAAPDAKVGFAAIRFLTERPAASLPLLAEKLKPVLVPDRAALRSLLERLDSPRFAEREKATKELAALADAAEADLREAAASGSAEVRSRLGPVLAGLEPTKLTGERLRAARAVEALERIGTAEARKLLTALARGAPGARLTRDAKEALARLGEEPR
jgi:RNA polymerase sigma factor (sigma-70 family)